MSCDLCGAANTSPVLDGTDTRYGTPGRFRVVRCARCGLARTDGAPADPADAYPSSGYYSYQAPDVPSLASHATLRAYGRPVVSSPFRRVAERLAGARLGGLPPGPPGDLLDVGCGSGRTLLPLVAAGWECHGVELDPGAVRAAHEAGLGRVRVGDLTEGLYTPASFDAVRFWHSLEHMPSPRRQLEEAYRVLRSGGSLTVGVPNFDSLLSRHFRERWFYLDLPRHLWHFDRRTLKFMLEATGFRIVRMRLITASSALLGTIGNVTSGPDPLLRNRLAWYAAQLPAAVLDVVGLGDELEVIARRG